MPPICQNLTKELKVQIKGLQIYEREMIFWKRKLNLNNVINQQMLVLYTYIKVVNYILLGGN